MSRVSRMKKSLLDVAVLLLVVAVAPSRDLFSRTLPELDGAIRLEFVVLDDETARPVKGAGVRLIDPFGYESDDGEELVMLSDDRGRVAISRDFDLGEVLNDAKNGNRIRVFGWRVKVTAKGYEPSTTPLFEHTGELLDERNPKVKHPNIRLHRGKGSNAGAGPRCEMFISRDCSIELSLVITGDRFDALASCPKLCSEHTPWFEVKHGSIKTVDGAFQLSVRGEELIRRHDGEEYNWLPNNLVPVPWGKRRYLIPREQGISFCNAVNQGEEPSEWRIRLLPGRGPTRARCYRKPRGSARLGRVLIEKAGPRHGNRTLARVVGKGQRRPERWSPRRNGASSDRRKPTL